METEVTIEFDDSDVWEAVEDTVRDEITNFIDEHTSEYEHDGIGGGNDVDGQVCELLTEYRNGSTPCDTGDAFEQAVWKAITRLDNPNVADEVWAAAAKEYLLTVIAYSGLPQVPRSRDVRAIVREEVAAIASAMYLSVNAQLGAEIAVAPGD